MPLPNMREISLAPHARRKHLYQSTKGTHKQQLSQRHVCDDNAPSPQAEGPASPLARITIARYKVAIVHSTAGAATAVAHRPRSHTHRPRSYIHRRVPNPRGRRCKLKDVQKPRANPCESVCNTWREPVNQSINQPVNQQVPMRHSTR
jgi:hypothetical protein